MKRSVKEIAQHVGAEVVGDATLALRGIASIASARAADLVFVESEANLKDALQSAAGAIITGSFGRNAESSKPLLICSQPRLAFSRAAELLVETKEQTEGVHPTAVIDPSAKLGAGVSVDAHAVIKRSCVIGAGTRIGAGASVAAGVIVGESCSIGANVTIYPGARLGNRVIVHGGAVLGSDGFGYVRDETTGKYHKFPQVGRLVIEDDVEIGANSTVDRGALDVTRIRRGTKIDNLVHVGHNVDIGEDVVIAAQTGLSGSAVLEDGVIVGGQVGIADHVRIESGAILGAQCGVPTKKIIRGKGVIFWGTPARPIREYLKELAVLVRLAKEK
ncbi:MAG TPA: UDP-3-O-(3-hydroxymyristoyl)glucosamine N-acyltransferase [Terriglobales bacterium]|nr:UDP-3-O-(3-hydroxymyristoyl)glucosamine N-acyltransferase [Terriglobales bacterium]